MSVMLVSHASNFFKVVNKQNFLPRLIHKIACRDFSKDSNMVPWREASSLILVSPQSHDSERKNAKNPISIMCDYSVLMVKRSTLSSFMANAFVFPGGRVEVSDFSPKWWNLFNKLNISSEQVLEFSNKITGVRPPLITSTLTLKQNKSSIVGNPLPSDVGLRISALRETFEETGILLLRDPRQIDRQVAEPKSSANDVNLKVWQKRIHDNPEDFLELCSTMNMCPDIWSLYEWSDWLTPPSVGHRRYDTIFYICFLSHQPKILLEESEVTIKRWCLPEEMLRESRSRGFFLAPPQLYELSRFVNFRSFEGFSEFAKQREMNGIDQWLPIVLKSDSWFSLLPGDDHYLEELKKIEGAEKETAQATEKKEAKNLNRIVMCNDQFIVKCNIHHCGHLPPVELKDEHLNSRL